MKCLTFLGISWNALLYGLPVTYIYIYICISFLFVFKEALTKYNETHQVQLRPPTSAYELPFVDARYCKPSLNSSITSRHSRLWNQKCWNSPRSLCKCSVDLFRHQIYDLFQSDCARVPNRSFGGHRESRIKQLEFVPSSKLTTTQSSLIINK